ncbi:MAG: RHS repeat-associated core domain-containing protein [Planctomyces sp.]|nr:RHS repeat-associated core domain-containing protein [Planctomyces sp.]
MESSGRLESGFYLFDGIHNVRQLTDSSQVVTDEYAFDAWGNTTSSTGSTANSQLWKGQYLAYRKDPNAGPELQYAMHHRNYNPATGVFTAADPAKDDLNLYRYVKNNPVNSTDPSGLEEKKLRTRTAELYEALESANGPSSESGASFDAQRKRRAELRADADIDNATMSVESRNAIESTVAAAEAASDSVEEIAPFLIDGLVRPRKPINAISEFVEDSVDTSTWSSGVDQSEGGNDWPYLLARIRQLAGGPGRTSLPDAVMPEPTSTDIQRAERDLNAAQELGEAGIERITTEVSDAWMGLRALEDANDNMTLPPLDSDGSYYHQTLDKFAGMGDSVKNTVEGLASPVQTAKGLAEAASHPGTTFRRIAEDVRDKSTQSRGQGEVASELIQAGAGPPVAGKVLGKAANWYRRLKLSIKGRITGGGTRTPTAVKTPLRAQPAEPPKPARPVKKPEPIRFQHPDLEDARKAPDDPLLERTIEFHQNPQGASAPNRWVGSKLSAEATQEAADSMARRISSLRAGGDEAIEQVIHVGSRKTGWSAKNNRPPLSTSDVDIAVNDWPWLKGSRHEAKVIKKMQDIASEFEATTGLKVELHLRSRYSKEQWAEYFGEFFR